MRPRQEFSLRVGSTGSLILATVLGAEAAAVTVGAGVEKDLAEGP
jgi:hypothetical protein